MLIVGTGGLARDVITSWEIDPKNEGQALFLFDDINTTTNLLYNKYKIFHTYEEVKDYFENFSRDFFVCVGNPLKRKRLIDRFEEIGGESVPFVSCKASIVSPETPLAGGVVIEPAVVVSKDVIIEKGVFVNAGSILGHDAILRQYVSIGPGVRILGHAEIGEFSYIGTNAIICPGVKIGKKVRIGMGKIIDKDVPDGSKI